MAASASALDGSVAKEDTKEHEELMSSDAEHVPEASPDMFIDSLRITKSELSSIPWEVLGQGVRFDKRRFPVDIKGNVLGWDDHFTTFAPERVPPMLDSDLCEILTDKDLTDAILVQYAIQWIKTRAIFQFIWYKLHPIVSKWSAKEWNRWRRRCFSKTINGRRIVQFFIAYRQDISALSKMPIDIAYTTRQLAEALPLLKSSNLPKGIVFSHAVMCRTLFSPEESYQPRCFDASLTMKLADAMDQWDNFTSHRHDKMVKLFRSRPVISTTEFPDLTKPSSFLEAKAMRDRSMEEKAPVPMRGLSMEESKMDTQFAGGGLATSISSTVSSGSLIRRQQIPPIGPMISMSMPKLGVVEQWVCDVKATAELCIQVAQEMTERSSD